MPVTKNINVAILFRKQLWAAVRVVISHKNDVYVNLDDDQKRHASYHASGQAHLKTKGGYVQWSTGPNGELEPMMGRENVKPTDVSERQSVAGGPWGWEIARIPNALRPCRCIPEMVVDAGVLPDSWALGLEVSIVNSDPGQRTEHFGCPIIDRRRFSNGVIVIEIEALGIDNADS
jgi:hypothetical protein